jgi:hypothetical protein
VGEYLERSSAVPVDRRKAHPPCAEGGRLILINPAMAGTIGANAASEKANSYNFA